VVYDTDHGGTGFTEHNINFWRLEGDGRYCFDCIGSFTKPWAVDDVLDSSANARPIEGIPGFERSVDLYTGGWHANTYRTPSWPSLESKGSV
jgi:hypothetical protein